MNVPNPNAQSLLVECGRGAEGLSRILCMFFPGVALIIAVMLIRDFIEPAIANSAWALCSTGLIGLGILRSKCKNTPTMLGTIIAVTAATYIFFQVASAHPDQWIFLGWAFGMFAIMLWAGLLHFGIEFSEHVVIMYGWPWRILGMIYVAVMLSVPFGLILLTARG